MGRGRSPALAVLACILILFPATGAAKPKADAVATRPAGTVVARTKDNGGVRQVVICTVDGHVYGVDLDRGTYKWSFLSGGPLVSSSVKKNVGQSQPDFTVIPGLNGDMYSYGSEDGLKKFDFSAKELVNFSPFVDNEGLVYVGKKDTRFYEIDPSLGTVQDIRMAIMDGDEGQSGRILLGRSEYIISVLDGRTRQEKWNLTVGEYVSSLYAADDDGSTPLPTILTTADGVVYCIDSDTGLLKWEFSCSSAPTNVYVTSSAGDLRKVVPINEQGVFCVKGRCYADYDIKRSNQVATRSPDSVFIGEYAGQLWASTMPLLPSLSAGVRWRQISDSVGPSTPDSALILYAGEDGCSGEVSELGKCLVGEHRLQNFAPVPQQQIRPPKDETTRSIGDGAPVMAPSPELTFKVALTLLWQVVQTSFDDNLPLQISAAAGVFGVVALGLRSFFRKSEPIKIKKRKRKPGKGTAAAGGDEDEVDDDVVDDGEEPVEGETTDSGGKPAAPSAMTPEAAVPSNPAATSPGSREGSREGSRSGKGKAPPLDGSVAVGIVTDEGLIIGKLLVTDNVLGKGSHGTIVYQGSFDGRPVAIKRILADFYDLAQHEIDHLMRYDTHRNIVRYHTREQDMQFVYVAIELCRSSLADLVESRDQLLSREREPTILSMQLMAEIVSGVSYLHQLNLVHRDIKPQNILLSHTGSAKISDFGLCKKLEIDRSSFDTHAAGTMGWQAPEALAGERCTRAVDVFAMGCVFYYMLTDGMHPFGSKYQREGNIIAGVRNMARIEHLPEAVDLIKSMTSTAAGERPPVVSVLQHPFFWNDMKRLTFLAEASDRIEIEAQNVVAGNGPLVVALESHADAVVGHSWRPRVDSLLLENLGKFRKYNFASLRDLLRLLRNKRSHYQDLPGEVQALVGELPSGFLRYFCQRFPGLLLSVWTTIRESDVAQEPQFAPYFENVHAM